jgi:outer membrane protein OmpA-like peptidoglycan-associated protein
VVLIPLALGAQTSAKPAAKAAAGDTASKWDIFAGYSFFDPNSHVDGTTPLGKKDPENFKTEKVGTVESLTRYFNDHWGLQIDSGQHDLVVNCSVSSWNPPGKPSTCFSNSAILTGQAGAVYRWGERGGKITPWMHALGGGGLLEGPEHQGFTPGYTFTAGGGLDRGLTPHWALRGEGDYEFMHVDFGVPHMGQPSVGWQEGGIANLEGIRLAAGAVYHIGAMAPPPAVTLMCSANPTSVFPGDPVRVTAMAGDLEPKMNVIYSLSGAGVTSSATSATVATGSLAPGPYTVNCGVKEGKPGKEGLKPWQSATASASFTVKQFEPPTISCAVSPTTIKPGDSANVTATAVSPQNRPLTYTYATSAGSIQGNGNTAIFSSVGAPTGPVTITCTVTDDKGQSASATINAASTVTITAPYVPPVPHTQALCSVSFAADKERPSRVTNEAKACLDEVALDLQKQPDAQAVVVGTSDAKEKDKLAKQEKLALKNKHLKVVDLAAERAVNVKDYLVTEKGIDAARISVATSATDGQTVEDYLVPSGATFTVDVAGTTPVSAEVKAEPRKPLHPVAHKKSAAAKKAAKPVK